MQVRGLAAAAVRGCSKPVCSGYPLDRHHLRHEKMWFGVWSWRAKQHGAKRKRWDRFLVRYAEFREEDIVRVCRRHHAEIHSIYDRIIIADQAALGKRLEAYTWPQAEALMKKLERACISWLKKKTPGIDDQQYGERKGSKRQALRRALRRR